MQRYDFDIIGTHLTLSLDTTEDCSEIFREIESRLRQFEAKYSRFLEGNWLHDLNRNRRAILDTDGMNMLSYMLDLARKTDGYFDPTVGKRLTELGYGKQMRNEEGVVRNIEAYGDYRNIEIAGDEVILHSDIELEFGGVGKGHLIDVIKIHLEKNARYLINFGGDLYGKGGWKVGLESPFTADEVIGTIVLEDDFLACSAGTRRKWGKHHHLIDPHTGESAREVVASYVEGNSGMMTDAYATTLCVMPWDLAVETLMQTPEVSGVIVRHDGVVYQKGGSRAEIFL